MCALCKLQLKQFHEFYQKVKTNLLRLEFIVVKEDVNLQIPEEPEKNESSDLMMSLIEIPQDCVQSIDLVKEEREEVYEYEEDWLRISQEPREPGEISPKFIKSMGVIPTLPEAQECNYCLKTFANKQNLKTHINEAHRSLRFECDLCKADFAKKYRLIEHMELRHSADVIKTSVACSICHKVFKTERYLNVHTTQIHGATRTPIKCQYCSQEFTFRCNLKRHIGRIHFKLRFECNFCKYASASRTQLLEHIQAHHMQ